MGFSGSVNGTTKMVFANVNGPIIVFEFVSAIIGCYTRQGMLPGEWKLCTLSAALKCIQ